MAGNLRATGLRRHVRLLRVCVAFGGLAIVLTLCAVIAVQCARLIDRNVSLSRELTVVKGEVTDLRRKRAEQERTIRRLGDPAGAVRALSGWPWQNDEMLALARWMRSHNASAKPHATLHFAGIESGWLQSADSVRRFAAAHGVRHTVDG